MPCSEAAKPHAHIDQQQAALKYHQNHQRPLAPLQPAFTQRQLSPQRYHELHYVSNQQNHQYGNQVHAQ